MFATKYVSDLIGLKFICQGKENAILGVIPTDLVEISYYFTNVHFDIRDDLSIPVVSDSSGYEFGDGTGCAVVKYSDYLKIKDKVDSDPYMGASFKGYPRVVVENAINGNNEFELVVDKYLGGKYPLRAKLRE